MAHKLRDFFIRIDSWTLELVGLSPNEPSFNSYMNLEVRFILNKITVLKPYKIKHDRFQIGNLYRDEDVMASV